MVAGFKIKATKCLILSIKLIGSLMHLIRLKIEVEVNKSNLTKFGCLFYTSLTEAMEIYNHGNSYGISVTTFKDLQF